MKANKIMLIVLFSRRKILLGLDYNKDVIVVRKIGLSSVDSKSNNKNFATIG